MIGEATLNIFDILRKNNGVVNKLNFPVTLKSHLHAHRSIFSNRGPSYLFVTLDGLSVDMTKFPSREGNQCNGQSSSVLNFDSQPSTSTAETNNVIAEITSSLPKWSVNDPLSSSIVASNGPITVNNSSDVTSNNPVVQSNNNTSIPLASPGTISGQQSNRASAPQIEEQLPQGWEIRFDTYGR